MPGLILFSFDVEEFDTPLEYGHAIASADQIDATRRGLDLILKLLDRKGVVATFFTTANYAIQCPDQVRELSRRHEVASHGFYHGHLEDRHLIESRRALEEIIGGSVVGFRRARMAATDSRLIRAAGYRYNSSENPTWIPGRYNNFFTPRRPYMVDGLLNIPASVTPRLRFPLFWLSFKNFPRWLIRLASSRVLQADGCINLYFHPWEFIDLSTYGLPSYVRRIDGQALVQRLEAYLDWLGERGRFTTFARFDAQWRAARAGGTGATHVGLGSGLEGGDSGPGTSRSITT